MDTKVLIVSVYYNRESMVDESVASIVSQLEPGMHLLLIDDGSKDNTLARLKAYEADNVTVIGQRNMGFVHSIRAGIEQFPCQYIAVHGSGDLALPGRFKKQADYLDQHPQVGVVGCHSRYVYSTGEVPPHVHAVTFSGDARERMVNGYVFHHGEVMMRRDCYDQVGGYRTFFKFAQDRDLFCRMSRITHFHVLDEVLYSRFVAVPGSVSATPEKVIEQRFLSDFACYCHAQCLAGKPDPLEKHGPRAALFWAPRKKTLHELFRSTLRAFYLQRPQDYQLFREALMQKDSTLSRRLLLLPAERFPGLTRFVLGLYFKRRVAALKGAV